MAEEMETVLVVDPRIIPQRATRVIRRGAENLSYEVVPAQGNSNFGTGTYKMVNNLAAPGGLLDASGTGASRHMFQISMGDQEQLVRRIDVRLTDVRIGFKATWTSHNNAPPANSRVLAAGLDALKAFPINRMLSNAQIKINGETVSVNPAQNLQCMLRTTDKQILQCTDNSLTPSYLDNVQGYADLTARGLNGAASERAVQNPLGYGTNYEPARGYFPQTWEVNQPLTAKADAADPPTQSFATAYFPVIQEPLMINCLYWGQVDEAGAFDNIKQDVEVTLQWLPDVYKLVWSHVNPAALVADQGFLTWEVTGISAQVNLIVTKLRRPTDLPGPSAIMTYPNLEFDRFADSSNQTLNAGETNTNYSTSSYKFGAIPQAWMIYFTQDTEQESGNNYAIPDRYARINSIQVTFNGVTGLLSGATTQHLYQMTINNLEGVDDYTYGDWCAGFTGNSNAARAVVGQGLQFQQVWDNGNSGIASTTAAAAYQRGAGSFLYLTPADIGLPSVYAPGMIGSYNFRLNASITNCSRDNWTTMRCYVFALYDGILSININGSATQSINVVDSASVLTSSQLPIIADSEVDMSRMIGGGPRSLFGRVGSFIHTATPYLKRAASIAKRVLPYTGPGGALIGDVLDAAGAGGQEDDGQEHLRVSGGAAGGGGRVVALDGKTKELALVSSILRRRR
jgi:hypothetical protein